jgi:ribonucleoside-diphosphate reductase subunit M1
MLYKDACNAKSNHKTIGIIKNSNLCAEIIEYSNENEHAACALASIAVYGHRFDFVKLEQVVRVVTRNLNKILDLNKYPTEGCKETNVSTLRPIGIGIQGLADLFMLLKYPFNSKEAKDLNKQIFESLYFAALLESCKLARETGQVYKHYYNTPLSKGILQFDLWGIKDKSSCGHWNTLKNLLKRYGARNSLLTACMPTASTAQILGNNESIEPITSNLYVRRTNAGDFHVTMSSICLILSKLLGLRLRSLASRLILSSFVSAMESFLQSSEV